MTHSPNDQRHRTCRRCPVTAVFATALLLAGGAAWAQGSGNCGTEADAAIVMSTGGTIPDALVGPARTARDAYINLCHFVLEHPILDDRSARRLADLQGGWQRAFNAWIQAERAYRESLGPGTQARTDPSDPAGRQFSDTMEATGTRIVPEGTDPSTIVWGGEGTDAGGGTPAGNTDSWPSFEAVIHSSRTDIGIGTIRVSWKRPPGVTQVRQVTLTITGRVLSKDGSPVPGATVHAGAAEQTDTDSLGRYRLMVQGLADRDREVRTQDLILRPAQPCLKILTPRLDLGPPPSGGPEQRLRFMNLCEDREIEVTMHLPADFSPGGPLSVTDQDVDVRSSDSYGTTSSGGMRFLLGPSTRAWVSISCRQPGAAECRVALTEAGQPAQHARVVCGHGAPAPPATASGTEVLGIAAQQIAGLSALLSKVAASPHLDSEAAQQKMERLRREQDALRIEAGQHEIEAEVLDLILEAQELFDDLVVASTLDAMDQGGGVQALQPGRAPIAVSTPPDRAEMLALGRDALAVVGSSTVLSEVSGTLEANDLASVTLSLADGAITLINDFEDLCRRAEGEAFDWLSGVTEDTFYRLVNGLHDVGETTLGWDVHGISTLTGEAEVISDSTAYEVARDSEAGVTEVTVFEGHVRIRPRSGGSAETVVQPGTRAVVDCQGISTERLSASELRRAARLSRRLLRALPATTPTAPPPSSGMMPPAPSRTFQAHEIGLVDADVYEYGYRNWNNANAGAVGSLTLGSRLGGTPGTRRRVFLRFDVDRLGVGPDRLVGVLLRLHGRAGSEGGTTIFVHAVQEPWQEGDGTYHSGQDEPDARPGWISWTRQPSFDSSRIWERVRVHSQKSEPFLLDITELVREWLGGARRNDGLVLVGDGEGSASYKIGIPSSESNRPEERPELIVTYR